MLTLLQPLRDVLDIGKVGFHHNTKPRRRLCYSGDVINIYLTDSRQYNQILSELMSEIIAHRTYEGIEDKKIFEFITNNQEINDTTGNPTLKRKRSQKDSETHT